MMLDGKAPAHLSVMRDVCSDYSTRAWRFEGAESAYALLGKYAHMLGFRGHFSTKSRRYSVTLGALRRARARWQALAAESRRTGNPSTPAASTRS